LFPFFPWQAGIWEDCLKNYTFIHKPSDAIKFATKAISSCVDHAYGQAREQWLPLAFIVHIHFLEFAAQARTPPENGSWGVERATAKESDELTRCSAPEQGGWNASTEPQGKWEGRDRRRHRGHGGQDRGRPGSPGHRGTRAHQGLPAGDSGKGGADAKPRSAGCGRRLESRVTAMPAG